MENFADHSLMGECTMKRMKEKPILKNYVWCHTSFGTDLLGGTKIYYVEPIALLLANVQGQSHLGLRFVRKPYWLAKRCNS